LEQESNKSKSLLEELNKTRSDKADLKRNLVKANEEIKQLETSKKAISVIQQFSNNVQDEALLFSKKTDELQSSLEQLKQEMRSQKEENSRLRKVACDAEVGFHS
jgi:ABC-type transporter Mla subunit MlaD